MPAERQTEDPGEGRGAPERVAGVGLAQGDAREGDEEVALQPRRQPRVDRELDREADAAGDVGDRVGLRVDQPVARGANRARRALSTPRSGC